MRKQALWILQNICIGGASCNEVTRCENDILERVMKELITDKPGPRQEAALVFYNLFLNSTIDSNFTEKMHKLDFFRSLNDLLSHLLN